jgi:hypothetical protein
MYCKPVAAVAIAIAAFAAVVVVELALVTSVALGQCGTYDS